jgi:hypothetical protein
MDLQIYDTIILTEDINPIAKAGTKGVILEKFNNESFEVEIFNSQNTSISYNNQITFTVNFKQITKFNL